MDTLISIHDNPIIRAKLLGGSEIGIKEDFSESLLAMDILRKLDLLDTDEKYQIDLCKKYITEEIDSLFVRNDLLKTYFGDTKGINGNQNIDRYDFLLDLLYNLKSAKDQLLLVDINIDNKYIGYINEENQRESARLYKAGQKALEEKDHDSAYKFFQQSVDLGNIDAIYELSECYYWGRGIDINYDKAVSLIRIGLDKGNNNCLFLMGRALSEENTSDYDLEKSKEYYRNAIEKCSDELVIGKSQGNLANILWEESSIEDDKGEIIRLYEQSMNNGSSISMKNLGNFYYDGYKIAVDYENAYYYLRQAAQHNNTTVYTRLGYMCEYGQGIKQDYKMAKYWYEMGMNCDDNMCINNLAIMYDNGNGVEQNYDKAMELYKMAINLGNEYAMCNLALMYEYGKGVERNIDSAIKYYKDAADRGFQRGIDALERLGV